MSEQPTFGVPEWTLGDRLGKSLDFAKLSVGEMADYLGISRNTVGNYLGDRTRIPQPTLTLWAMRTGVPKKWIETGTTSPHGDGGSPMSITNGYRTTRGALSAAA